MDQTPVVRFDEWAGVLNLATMWAFQEVLFFFFFAPTKVFSVQCSDIKILWA